MLLLFVAALACECASHPVSRIRCPLWHGERTYVLDIDTIYLFVVLDFPRTSHEVVVDALIRAWQDGREAVSTSGYRCMTLRQLLKGAEYLNVPVTREQMEASLREAQLTRIQRLSAGRPADAAQMYAAAAAVDPHVSTYHLLLGSELASLGNLTGSAAAFSAAISCLGANQTHAAGGQHAAAGSELVRARMGLALALEGLLRHKHAAALRVRAAEREEGGDEGCKHSADAAAARKAAAAGVRKEATKEASTAAAARNAVAAGVDVDTGAVIEQYQALLSLHPDAEAAWYLPQALISRPHTSTPKP